MSAGTPQEDVAVVMKRIRGRLYRFTGLVSIELPARCELVRKIDADLDRLEQRLARLEEAAAGFIETMGMRYSDIAKREVPDGFTAASHNAAIKLFDVLAAAEPEERA